MSNVQLSVQPQIDAVQDPIARLPFELSSQIFVHFLHRRCEPGSRHIPMLFLNVCSAWSDIALSTPALWAAIHVEFPRGEGFTKFLETWLKRAGNYFLSISLHGVFNEDVAALVWQHAAQLKSLEICHDLYHPHILTPAALGPFPFLETLTLGRYKSCVDLSIRHILEMLRHAPNLVELNFDWADVVERNYTSTESLVLPSLRGLRFGTADGDLTLEGNLDLLIYLTSPALETLVLATIRVAHVHSFLVRSSPPLRELLFLGLDHDGLTFIELDQCLQLVPLLTHFEFLGANTDLIDDFLHALAQSPSTFLPNLRILKIGHCWSNFEDFVEPSYDDLLRVLSVRRSRIVCFSLTFNADGVSSDYGAPGASLRAAFRQLAAAGMDIYIGDGDENFLEVQDDECSDENEYWEEDDSENDDWM
ncbi:hypothetical protein DFH06DRAFT_484121 [Mycena polygramma]|nr:hypothetical protein DFH06DRAFT_484121 [Mycena polygramma]